jgi:hypothetical protein
MSMVVAILTAAHTANGWISILYPKTFQKEYIEGTLNTNKSIKHLIFDISKTIFVTFDAIFRCIAIVNQFGMLF